MSTPEPFDVYAWICRDPESEEGWSQITTLIPGLGHAPLAHRNPATAKLMENIAYRHALSMRQPVRLVRLAVAEELIVLDPGAQ